MGGIFGAFCGNRASRTADVSSILKESEDRGPRHTQNPKEDSGSLLEDIYLGLYALQHRGQESAGIAWRSASCGETIKTVKGMGLLHDSIDQDKLLNISCESAIGHVRYSKDCAAGVRNAHPLVANYARGAVAVAHDGAISNASQLTEMLENRGAIFQSSCDTEVLLHLMAHQSQKPPLEALLGALRRMRGGYAIAVLLEDKLVAARDPLGFRPLVIGSRDDVTYVASESCALDIVGAKLIRDVEPGELLVIDRDGIKSIRILPPAEAKCICSFEFVYLARPDSVIEGRSVNEVRKELGRLLAKKSPCEGADMVSGMPDSGTLSALGYAQESGTPFELAIVRNRYVGRTFIRPTQRVRDAGVRIKLNPNQQMMEGKKVVIVDDSIVRGTTAQRVVSTVKECGTKEINMRIASPPVRFPCRYGIDMPSEKGLAASRVSVEELCSEINADSLAYLEMEDLVKAVNSCACKNKGELKLCTACFCGEYPDQSYNYAAEVPNELEL